MLDAFLELRFLDDPAEVVRISGDDLVVALAAILPDCCGLIPCRRATRSAAAAPA